jgi:hypothetical protein
MTSAYVASLRRHSEADAQINEQDVCSLRQRFIDWYSALPEISRSRAFAMAEIEAALSTQGKYLSPVLLSLGWTRKRRWSSGGQYNRYWAPPPSTLTELKRP